MIDYDLETTPLEIKTDSKIGSGNEVRARFYASPGDLGGGFNIRFTSPLQYYLSYCSTSWTNFPANPPNATDKTWRVTLIRSSGITVVIHCNEVEVLNFLLSNSTCSYSKWSAYWSRTVTKIRFPLSDTASDFYTPAGKNLLMSRIILNGT
jgi:hypothetical protein